MNDTCRKVLGPIFRTSALVAGLVGGYYHRVFAGSCTNIAGTYVCSGETDRTTDTTQNLISGSPLTITTSSGFGIDTSLTGGEAFYFDSAGGLSFTDSNGSSIVGSSVGILAHNTGGTLSITTSGTVVGGAGGIVALNYGSNLFISADNVSGGMYGIYAINVGTGPLKITSSGSVKGISGDGIYAVNIGTGLSISANNVEGYGSGIFALNFGSGPLTISTSGSVTGSNADGITAVNLFGSSTSITVGPESEVRGKLAGIYAYSGFGQPITITVDGRVENISGSPADLAIETVGGPTTVNLNANSQTTGSILLDNYNDTVNLIGYLDGSVRLEGGNDTFFRSAGSVFTGVADGGSGKDTLGLAGVGTVDGSNYINFEHLAIYGGSNNLTGAWNFNGGGATVYNGTLLVNGTLSTPLVTVLRDGLIGGSGTVYGDVRVYGTLSPGNSIGTFKVNGALDFMPGSTYEVVLAASGQSDRLEVSGPVSISGSTLLVSLRRELYQDGTNWKLISAGGGINGRFTSIRENFSSSTLSLSPYYAGGSMGMVIHRTPYSYFGTTPNQQEVAGALDTLLSAADGSMQELLISMDFDLSPAQISATLDGLSPELYTSFAPSAIAAVDSFSDIASFRQQEMRHPAGEQEPAPLWSVWGRAFGQRQNHDGDTLYSGYTARGAGLVLGLDRAFGATVRAGMLLGHSSSDLSWETLDGSGKISGRHIALYSSAAMNGYYLDGRIGYTGIDNSSCRRISAPVYSACASAAFDSSGIEATVSGGYDFQFGILHVGPVASLSYLYLDQDGLTDHGAGPFSVRLENKSLDIVTGSGGIRLMGTYNSGDWKLQPAVKIAINYRSWDDAETLEGYFPGYPFAGFTISGPELDNASLQTTAGLTADYGSGLRVFVNGGMGFSDTHESLLLSGGLVWKF